MATAYQVVEKDGYATDWALVRYNEKALTRFDDQESAVNAAIAYITDTNCNNSLTPDEKLAQFECFMQTEQGIFLGNLDGKPWYLSYPKNIVGKNDEGEVITKYTKGDPIKDTKFFLLEGKTEVAVRILPGSDK